MDSVLYRHKKVILSRKEVQFGCSCRNTAECPLDISCLIPKLTYQTDVLTNLSHSKRFYVGFPKHHLKSVIETIQKILEINIMKRAQNFQNLFGY